MDKIYTIGFTKKSAEKFFDLLIRNNISIVLDIRLNNTSQLAGFSKFPDIKFFLEKIGGIDYLSDIRFAPEDWILKNYKSGKMTWDKYVIEYQELMKKRNTEEYILKEYSKMTKKNICLLCSEDRAENCHRLLVAKLFQKQFGCDIINL
ncbi:MAG: DUF488 domain-containing protein [Hungatella sp.]